MPKKRDKPKSGSKPETRKIEGTWTAAAKKALAKKKLGGGWLKPSSSGRS